MNSHLSFVKLFKNIKMKMANLTIDEDIVEAMNEADRIYIIAAGTSYHAGLVGKQYIEKLANIPVEVHISSEFGYNMPLLSAKAFIYFYFTKR